MHRTTGREMGPRGESPDPAAGSSETHISTHTLPRMAGTSPTASSVFSLLAPTTSTQVSTSKTNTRQPHTQQVRGASRVEGGSR